MLLPKTWSLPPERLALAVREVVVCKFNPQTLLDFSARLESLLSAHEQQRLAQFKDRQARDEFVLCRGVLNLWLAVLTGESPEKHPLSAARHEKPHVVEDQHTHPLSFNISHTQGLCLFACAHEMELGVDAEHIEPLPELAVMADKFLAPREMAQWQAALAAQQTGLFHRYWSAKEALLKALGSGLRITPNQIHTLEVLGNKTFSGRQADGSFFEIDACFLEALPLGLDYAGWLAVFGQPARVYLYELDARWLAGVLLLLGGNIET